VSPAKSRAAPLRERLLREATEILARDGFAGLTVRKVADAAGCSTIGIYTHFRDKRGLVEAVLLDAFGDFEAALSAVDSMPPGREQIIASAHAYRRWALANPSRYLIMFTSLDPHFVPSPEVGEQLSRSLHSHTQRVVAAIAVGDLLADDPEGVAYHLWACEHGYVMLHLFHQREFDFDAAYRRVLDGVTPRGRRQRSP
jgi:AcrR family transcriptional regulator